MAKLTESLGVSRKTINEILRELRAMTSLMALRLARLFGNTPEFWLNARRAYDLCRTEQVCGQEINKIKPLRLDNRGASLWSFTMTWQNHT